MLKTFKVNKVAVSISYEHGREAVLNCTDELTNKTISNLNTIHPLTLRTIESFAKKFCSENGLTLLPNS